MVVSDMFQNEKHEKEWPLCFPIQAGTQDIKSQTRAPGAVRWGHSWPHEWTLSKKTLWRYPFWWLNRLSPEIEANTDKKYLGKTTAHGTGMIKYLRISATDCMQASDNFSLTHSYAYPKLQNLQSWRRGWWVSNEFAWHENDTKAPLHKNPRVENTYIMRDSKLPIHQNNLPKTSLSLSSAQKLAVSFHVGYKCFINSLADMSLVLNVSALFIGSQLSQFPTNMCLINFHTCAWAQTIFSARWTSSSWLHLKVNWVLSFSCSPLSHSWQTLDFYPIFHEYLYCKELGPSKPQETPRSQCLWPNNL